MRGGKIERKGEKKKGEGEKVEENEKERKEWN